MLGEGVLRCIATALRGLGHQSRREMVRSDKFAEQFSSLPDCFTYYKTIPFTPIWYVWPSPFTHTHYMVPFAPLGRSHCSVKPRLGVI